MQSKGLLDSDGNPQQGELLFQEVIARALGEQLIDLPGFLQGLLEPARQRWGKLQGLGSCAGRELLRRGRGQEMRPPGLQDPLGSAFGTGEGNWHRLSAAAGVAGPRCAPGARQHPDPGR